MLLGAETVRETFISRQLVSAASKTYRDVGEIKDLILKTSALLQDDCTTNDKTVLFLPYRTLSGGSTKIYNGDMPSGGSDQYQQCLVMESTAAAHTDCSSAARCRPEML